MTLTATTDEILMEIFYKQTAGNYMDYVLMVEMMTTGFCLNTIPTTKLSQNY